MDSTLLWDDLSRHCEHLFVLSIQNGDLTLNRAPCHVNLVTALAGSGIAHTSVVLSLLPSFTMITS